MTPSTFLGTTRRNNFYAPYPIAASEFSFSRSNRDFLVGEKFADECGIQLIADEHILKVGQRQVLLMHGDSLCIDDLSHQKFRAMVRSPSWQKTFLEKTIVERDGLAKLARYHSEDGKAQKSMEIMDVNPEEARKTIAHHDVEILIHGHTHRPAIHRIEGREAAYRVVLETGRPSPVDPTDRRGGVWLSQIACSACISEITRAEISVVG